MLFNFVCVSSSLLINNFLDSNGTQARILPAQDSQNRHVVVKVISENSEEYRIVSYLHQLSSIHPKDSLENVVPILDLLKCDKYCFAVMPRSVYVDPVCLNIPDIAQMGSSARR